jgi:hypothetical protein
MRRLVTVLVVSSLLACAVAAATALGAGGVPAFPRLAGHWSHAEINVTIRRKQHTLILDQGRITKASVTEITLLEPDGTVAVVPISPDAIVRFRGRLSDPSVLRRKLTAQTMRIDDGAAVRILATP